MGALTPEYESAPALSRSQGADSVSTKELTSPKDSQDGLYNEASVCIKSH